MEKQKDKPPRITKEQERLIKADQVRVKFQKIIKKDYPDLSKKCIEELCKAPCRDWTGKDCVNRLLPVTSTGEKCPYFRALV